MPSHSPYALSNLTLVKFSLIINCLINLELHKNKRFLFEIEVYPYIFSLLLEFKINARKNLYYFHICLIFNL